MSDPFNTKEARGIIFGMLKVLGGQKVVVSFQGGGDSGEIEEAALFDAKGEIVDLDGITYPWPEEVSIFDDGKQTWDKKTQIKPTSLSDILRNATEQMLENEGLDWYNNDGGQGEMTIDLTKTPPTVTLNVGINYTQTDNHSFDYTDTEEEDEDSGMVTSEEGK